MTSLDEIRSRQSATREVQRLISQIGAICQRWPEVYGAGEGFGTALHVMLTREFNYRGLETKPPRRKKGEGWDSVRKSVLARHTACSNCQSKTDLTVDHKTPRCRGGKDARANLQVLCRPCNSTKGTMTQQEWERHYSKRLAAFNQRRVA